MEKKKEKQRAVKLNSEVEEFKRSELLEKYTVKILFRWNDNKFDNVYLKKLEKNWARWKIREIGKGEISSSGDRTKGGTIMMYLNTNIFLFFYLFFLI